MKYSLIYSCLIVIAFTGCTTQLKLSKNEQLASSVLVYVQDASHLPSELLTVLQQVTLNRFPDSKFKLNNIDLDDTAFAMSDRMIAIRISHVSPNYSYKPTDNSALNGELDCFLGSSFGAGIVITPCEYSLDHYFFEATVRNGNSQTLATYTIEQRNEDWMWPLPFSSVYDWIRGRDQKQIWLELIENLSDKILSSGILNTKTCVQENQSDQN